MQTNHKLSAEQAKELILTLKSRFEKNSNRHEGLKWESIQNKIESNPDKLWSLYEMERTGGEPDVTSYDKELSTYTFVDCSTETPSGRRSLCYDRQALNARKEHKPKDSVLDMASAMGVELLTEEQYYELQNLGDFDLKTSSWIQTPKYIRDLGGALFCDFRYKKVFVYHNGADSYYNTRGFRALLKV